MKLALGVVMLMLAIIGGATGFYVYSAAIFAELHEIVDDLEAAVHNEDWDAAAKANRKLQEVWSKGDALWATVIDHSEVDRVDESVVRIDILSQIRLQEDLLVEITTARRLISRLQDNEKPTLQSIL